MLFSHHAVQGVVGIDLIGPVGVVLPRAIAVSVQCVSETAGRLGHAHQPPHDRVGVISPNAAGVADRANQAVAGVGVGFLGAVRLGERGHLVAVVVAIVDGLAVAVGGAGQPAGRVVGGA